MPRFDENDVPGFRERHGRTMDPPVCLEVWEVRDGSRFSRRRNRRAVVSRFVAAER